MFSLLRMTIWFAGTVTVVGFVLGFAGYRINWDVAERQRDVWTVGFAACREIAFRRGIEGLFDECRPVPPDLSGLLTHKE